MDDRRSPTAERANSANLIGLLYVGLVLAAAAMLSARQLLNAHVLIPECEATCAAAQLSYHQIATQQKSIKSYFKTADTCLCAHDPTVGIPPRCTAAWDNTVACDAGFWFAGGRSLITLGVTLATGVILLGPAVVAALLRWRSRLSRR